jgi:cytoskeletal protein RodZ
MRVGTELREARERAGLSAEQIAERTKIQLYRIEALENDNFEHLPSGIYLDGIVRAYAHEVAVNPEPLIERVRYERGEAAKNWQAGPADLDSFSSERQVANDVEARTTIGSSKVVTPPERGVVGTSSVNDDIDLDVVDRPAQVVETPTSQLEPTRSAQGPGRFVLPLLLLLAAVGLGAYFYVSTGRFNRGTPPDTVASSPRPAPADTAIADSSTTPTTTVTSGDRSAAAPADRPPVNTGTATRETEVAAGTSGPKERATSGPVPSSAPRNGPGASSSANASTPAAPKRGGPPASAGDVRGSAKDVSGAWTVATHVESSSYAPFQGLQLGYDIQLEQRGNRVTGTGRKVTENGDGTGSRARTPISLAGTINGDRLALTFNERGARRPTQGKFVLLLDEGGTMRGRFSSTAAQSSGTVEAHRPSR